MKKKLRTVAMMLALALPVSLLAQGGLFQRGVADEEYYGFGGNSLIPRNGQTATNLSNQGFGNPNGSDLTNQTFDVPLGSGLLILLLAGAGYSAMKNKQKKQQQ